MNLNGYIKLARLSEIEMGHAKRCEIDNDTILICHTSKGVYAVKNQCSHQMAELDGGKIKSCFIFCPLHGQRFDLRDGSPIGKLTNKPIQTYAVKTNGDDIFVNLTESALQD